MSADEIIDKGFEDAESRMAALRITPQELVKEAGVAYSTYWRAKTAETKGRTPRIKLLRRVEAMLDKKEGRTK